MLKQVLLATLILSPAPTFAQDLERSKAEYCNVMKSMAMLAIAKRQEGRSMSWLLGEVNHTHSQEIIVEAYTLDLPEGEQELAGFVQEFSSRVHSECQEKLEERYRESS